MCTVTKQKKKVEDDKTTDDDDKRKMATRLDERIRHVQKLTHKQFDMLNQLLNSNQELNKKNVENDHMRNDLRSKKEFIERLPKEIVR